MTFNDLLEKYSVESAPEGHHHTTSGRVQLDCPLCSPGSHRFRLGFSSRKKSFNCWSCGFLPLIPTLMQLLKEPYTKCKEIASALDGTEEAEVSLRGTLEIPYGVGSLLSGHKKYLRSRGFDPEELEKLWDIQGIGVAPKLSWRIFIPVHLGEEVVSWTTRGLTDKEPRYISAKPSQERLGLKEVLYGNQYFGPSLIVVEGPLDVWRIGPGAGATFGKTFSRAQVNLISKFPTRVICFDADAKDQAAKLCSMLNPLPGNTWNVCLDSKDPGSATEKEIKRLRKFLQ